jgi:predicted TIM-barrel fold metal-dependent hydrolase
MIIDAHQHLFRGFEEAAALANSGIVDQVWLLSCPVTKLLHGDEEVLEICKAFPDFFVPFGFLDFDKNVDAIDEQKDKGFVGMKAIYPPKPYGDESLFPYYERIEKLRMPLLIHAAGAVWGETSKLNVTVEKKRIGGRFMHVYHLDIIAKLFSDLTIIGAHLGAPWHDEAINIACGHKNVYFDISNGFLVRKLHKVKEALAIPGFEEKLLFGTDAGPHLLDPVTKMTHFWEVFFSGNFTEEIKDKIMGGNAKELLLNLVQ